MNPEHEALLDAPPRAARCLRRSVGARARSRTRTSRPSGASWTPFLQPPRDGDFDGLVAVLDPDVVLRADFGAAGKSRVVRGAREVAGQALLYSQLGLDLRPVLVNGAFGTVTFRDGAPFSVGAVTVRDGKIVELDFLADPERLRELDLTVLD